MTPRYITEEEDNLFEEMETIRESWSEDDLIERERDLREGENEFLINQALGA